MDKLSHDGFFGHPMNRLMLKGTPLAQYDPQELALKYIALAQSGRRPTDEEVEAVRTGVIEFCKKVHGEDEAALAADIRGIEQSWPVMRERFANSLGLTQMMLDYGVNSRYFYQYLYLTGQKLFAVALEAKDGYAMPVSGEQVFEKVPEGDWMLTVCVEEPSHPARRGTDGTCQTLLRNAKTIFEAGAGLMPAYRHYDYPLGRLDQKIVACDSDPRLREYLDMVFERPLDEYGIDYHVCDLMELMDDPDYSGQFDVVRMTGLLSYFPDHADKRAIMQKAQRLLKPTGVILTDFWTMGPSLGRTALTGLWPIDPSDPHRLAPANNEAEAVNEMGDICKDLGLPFVHVGDICNGNPRCWTQARAVKKCVMFLVGEGVTADMFDLIPTTAE